MKNYPKSVADAAIMYDVLQYLYTQSESFTERAEDYKQRAAEYDGDAYYFGEATECAAKAAACVRLAEKLAK